MKGHWFKFYGQDFLTDPKIMRLNSIQKLMWVGLLCVASQSDGEVEHLEEDNLKLLIGLDPNDEEWKLAGDSFKKFKELKMITMITNSQKMITHSQKNSKIIVKNFKKRQNRNLTGYERIKRYRAKKRLNQRLQGDNNDNVQDNANDNARVE